MEEKTRTKENLIKGISLAVIMLLATRIMTLYYTDFIFLKYVFFVVPVYFIISGGILGVLLKYNPESKYIKLLVVACSVSIFQIFFKKGININYVLALQLAVLFCFHYLYFILGFRFSMMIIYWKKKVDILNRPVLKLWPLILPFILSVPFYLYLTMPIKEGAYASYAERLLEQKYSEKFEISNMRFPIESITGLLINTYPFSYFYNFYPVNNPDLKTHGIISPYRGSDECIDGYGILVACTEMKAMIKPYIDKIADNNYYEVLLQPKYYNKEKGKIIWDKKVADELYLLKIPLKKVLKDKKGKFFISLQVYYAYDITDGNKEKVFKDVYSLYHFLEENGVNTVHMSIKFFSRKKFNDEPIYNYYKKTPNSFSYKYRPYNNIYMTYDNMNTVNSYKDIAEYFNMPLDIKYRNKLKK